MRSAVIAVALAGVAAAQWGHGPQEGEWTTGTETAWGTETTGWATPATTWEETTGWATPTTWAETTPATTWETTTWAAPTTPAVVNTTTPVWTSATSYPTPVPATGGASQLSAVGAAIAAVFGLVAAL